MSFTEPIVICSLLVVFAILILGRKVPRTIIKHTLFKHPTCTTDITVRKNDDGTKDIEFTHHLKSGDETYTVIV